MKVYRASGNGENTMRDRTTPLKRASIFCRNIEESLALYRDILGFTVAEDKTVTGPAIAKMIGLEDCSMHICHLKAQNSEDGLIGLYEITADDLPETTLPPIGKIHRGQVALVVNTDAPDDIYKDLESAGYSFLTLPTKYVKEIDTDYMKAGTYTEMIFYDPDGVLVSILGYEPLQA
jgi:catechol 2,3-dioxygenase-like lactoylglutathione lyase family enzyme